MNQQPDKLFREKLEGYQRPAPASAWEKIAAARTKKNDKWPWLKIAASIALVATVGYLLMPDNETTDLSREKSSIPPEKNTITKERQSVEKSAEKVKPETITTEDKSVAAAEGTKAIQEVSTSKHNDHPIAEAATQPEVVQPMTERVSIEENIAAVETNVEPVTEETPASIADGTQTITLVYSAKDVEEYLDKKSLEEATSDSKKSSTLKKLLKKAEDLTNNQDPFGELRQKKNEILALNFKNEKQRGQNK